MILVIGETQKEMRFVGGELEVGWMKEKDPRVKWRFSGEPCTASYGDFCIDDNGVVVTEESSGEWYMCDFYGGSRRVVLF